MGTEHQNKFPFLHFHCSFLGTYLSLSEWEQEISLLSDNMVNTSEERYYNDGADDGDLQSK